MKTVRLQRAVIERTPPGATRTRGYAAFLVERPAGLEAAPHAGAVRGRWCGRLVRSRLTRRGSPWCRRMGCWSAAGGRGRGGEGGRIRDQTVRRYWIRRHSSPPNQYAGGWPDVSRVGVALVCGRPWSTLPCAEFGDVGTRYFTTHAARCWLLRKCEFRVRRHHDDSHTHPLPCLRVRCHSRGGLSRWGCEPRRKRIHGGCSPCGVGHGRRQHAAHRHGRVERPSVADEHDARRRLQGHGARSAPRPARKRRAGDATVSRWRCARRLPPAGTYAVALATVVYRSEPTPQGITHFDTLLVPAGRVRHP